jgi:hypothetical protein
LFLCLNLIQDYDSVLAGEILGRDVGGWLDLFQDTPENRDGFSKKSARKSLESSKLQIISLLRRLLEFSGGKVMR